jgi:hypothetical protein
MPPVNVLNQLGYIESLDQSPSSVEMLFGKAANDPLVLSHHSSHLEMGGRNFNLDGVVTPLSGVQTVDLPGAGDDPRYQKRSAGNLLKPMHSESFWVMLLVLAALGIFSFGIHIGPVKAEVGKP